MRAFQTVTGRAMPLPRADVDTDQIIPARHLKRTGRTGLGAFAFEAWRRDPGFVVNDPRYKGAPILITGPNFGCGSSREHAPWALEDLGVRVIVAPSFADIFRLNCARVGLLTVVLGAAEVDALTRRVQDDPSTQLRVNLREQTLRVVVSVVGDIGGSEVHRFEVDPFVKHCLLEGLDAIALSLSHEVELRAHEARRPAWMPRTSRGSGGPR
ncbi:3-isopropylmalate isomerase, subunit with LeuC [Plesiocystis pacifica SIR-1]|uniref:3-isopropylmalate dehydratase small subunit n=1 Tax=Plesiocystis pacifica SIR-1 TaxID=391625 RepID=A6GIC7_9BACT|nr:3-isopropylmalate dehydratase small subunit [Plesiocystis pacifica]EDM74380.1 3-isopropylmalate isomerase, subunit with LeuC [Plesiocystis pacifica SIR-1]